MAKVVIFGTGQLADVAHFYLTHDSPHEILAFTADSDFVKSDQHLGLPVVPFERVEERYPPDEFRMFVPISYRHRNRLRESKFRQAKEKGYSLISYICSRAVTWPGLTVGENCFIFEANVIQPFVEIGDNVVLWSGNHIGHHSRIGDHCFLASHVVVSGSVTIEPFCFLGVNSTIRDGITIARECIIGAGSLILEDTEPRGVYPGSPATRLGGKGRSRKEPSE
jgi:sugar O-acyltransferase (sialic acid O-acetyltransferase NeuD family)